MAVTVNSLAPIDVDVTTTEPPEPPATVPIRALMLAPDPEVSPPEKERVMESPA